MLSVTPKSPIQIFTRFAILVTMLATINVKAQDVDPYEAAGRPPMNKMIFNNDVNQWGYWSIPGGPEGFEADENAPEPLFRSTRHSRPAPVPYVETRTVRRPRENARIRPLKDVALSRPDAPVPASGTANEEDPWNSLPSSARVKPALETDCVKCAAAIEPIVPEPTSARARKAAREIVRVARNDLRRNRPAKDQDYQSEYEAVDDQTDAPVSRRKSRRLTPFVRRLLKNAQIEANRRVRHSRRGLRHKKGHKGMGLCLQGVRMALQATAGESINRGGIGTEDAKNAGPHLRKYGYTKASLAKYSPSTAPEGSILIYNTPLDRRHAGHIEIVGENGFYSDYFDTRPGSELMHGRRKLIGIYLPPTT